MKTLQFCLLGLDQLVQVRKDRDLFAYDWEHMHIVAFRNTAGILIDQDQRFQKVGQMVRPEGGGFDGFIESEMYIGSFPTNGKEGVGDTWHGERREQIQKQ